jgi:hypothetical protein
LATHRKARKRDYDEILYIELELKRSVVTCTCGSRSRTHAARLVITFVFSESGNAIATRLHANLAAPPPPSSPFVACTLAWPRAAGALGRPGRPPLEGGR